MTEMMKLLLDFFFLNVKQNKPPLYSQKVAFPSYENQIRLKYSPWKGLPVTHGPFFCLSHTKGKHHKRERKGRGHGSTRITTESHSQHWKVISFSGASVPQGWFQQNPALPSDQSSSDTSNFPVPPKDTPQFSPLKRLTLLVPAASRGVSGAALPAPFPCGARSWAGANPAAPARTLRSPPHQRPHQQL